MRSELSKWLQKDNYFCYYYSLIFPKFRVSLFFPELEPDTLGGALTLANFLRDSRVFSGNLLNGFLQ